MSSGNLSNCDDNKAKYLGLENNAAYCFLNSTIQLFYSFGEFSKYIIWYHDKSQIYDYDGSDDDKTFVNDFCHLIFDLRNPDPTSISKSVLKFQEHFNTSSPEGDDVHKCIVSILTRLGRVKPLVIHKPDSIPGGDLQPEVNPLHLEVKKYFYGDMKMSTYCKGCKKNISTKNQTFNTIPLPIDVSERATLNSCLDLFLSETEVIRDETKEGKCCEKPEHKSKIEIVKAPLYLILYLNRGSYYEGAAKNDSHIESNEILTLSTSSGDVIYGILAVIDHFGTNVSGHYIAKCNREEKWWYFSDLHVREVQRRDVVTHNSILFAFKQLG